MYEMGVIVCEMPLLIVMTSHFYQTICMDLILEISGIIITLEYIATSCEVQLDKGE